MTQSNFVDESVKGWSRLLPDRNLLGLEVFQRLIWSGRLAHKLMERAAKASGLQRRGDYEVLALLRRSEPMLLSPLQVARQLLTSQSGMTGKLDRLESQGLIKRTPDPLDRRAIRLEITDRGRKSIDRAFAAGLDLYESMLGGLSQVEVEDLGQLLEKLLDRLDGLAAARDAKDDLDRKSAG